MTSGIYHSVECCDITRGIDNLLARYKQDREQIIKLVETDPDRLVNTLWKHTSPLAIDDGCRCQMGKGDIRSIFSCAQCKNLRRLIDFKQGGIGVPFQIKCGKSIGKNLIIVNNNLCHPYLSWNLDSCNRTKSYLKQYQNIITCGSLDNTKISDMRFINGDTFTIRTLITWMIQKIFDNKGLPHVPSLHTAFICRGTGYSLYDMPSIGMFYDLTKVPSLNANGYLDPRIAKDIIIQVLVILKELSNVNFTHGNPSLDGLLFNKEPVSYLYDGYHVDSSITVQIAGLWNSSATFNNVHYFPNNIDAEIVLDRNTFAPDIATRNICSKDSCESSLMYRLNNSTIDIYNAIRHIGFPLYVGSLDFYCFIVSLMSQEAFYKSVMSDESLKRLWSMMWLPEDIETINKLVTEDNDLSPVGIIRGSWLRCDIVSYMWNIIKKGI